MRNLAAAIDQAHQSLEPDALRDAAAAWAQYAIRNHHDHQGGHLKAALEISVAIANYLALLEVKAP